jgi:hypothetical protein
MSAPTRRAVLGATAAGVAAGVPAVAIAAAPGVASPDARLIALCAEYQRQEAEYRRLSTLPDIVNVSDEAVAADDQLQDHLVRYRALMDEIAGLPATTPAGLQAKSRAVQTFYAFDGGRPGTTFAQDYPIQRMTWSLITDAEGIRQPLPMLPPTPADADAALIARCAECVRLDAEYERAAVAIDILTSDPRHGTPEHLAAEAAFEAVFDQEHAAIDRAAALPARTREGLAAKARALLTYYHGDVPEDDVPCGRLLASLLNDLAGGGA